MLGTEQRGTHSLPAPELCPIRAVTTQPWGSPWETNPAQEGAEPPHDLGIDPTLLITVRV